MKKGLFIVLYGANNVGKTTQIVMLTEALAKKKLDFLKIKYPLYNFEPTGPLVNTILRAPDTLDKEYSELEFQTLTAQNRKDFQPTLNLLLDAKINIIAEDYTGTGIAWGLVRGVHQERLDAINEGLIKPDLAILLDMEERYRGNIEAKHRNEDAGEEIWEKSRNIHRELAKKYGWEIVKADQTREKVHEDIMKLVEKYLQ